VATRTSAASPRALVLAAAIPILFLHVRYQPGFSVGIGSTSVSAYLSDFAVLAVVLAGAVSGLRDGFAPLRHGRAVWLAAAAFFVWVFVEVAYGRVHQPSYPWQTHGVTAAKFLEYALMAPALPLLVRTLRDLVVPLWSLVLWSVFATGVGVAQFFGAAIFLSGTVGRRQASFLSSADFAALSSAALLVGVVALTLPRLHLGRRLGIVATVTGTLGMIVAGAIASVLGLLTALAALAVVLLVRRELAPRRAVVAAGVALVVVLGAVAIRGSDLDAFARFLGASPGAQTAPPSKIETYAHRTLLVWLGYQIWKDNPLLGVGWEGSTEPANFEPYIPAAHRKFPDESPLAFPSREPDRRYGVQNIWVQALSDLGVVGLVLLVALFCAGAWTAASTAIRLGTATALLGLAWIALLVWLWTAQGFIAGIPLDALTWLAFGLAATRGVAR
jgi:O-antigen ligase